MPAEIKSVELDNEPVQEFRLNTEKIINIVENQGNIDMYYVDNTNASPQDFKVHVFKYGDSLDSLPNKGQGIDCWSIPVNGRVYHFFVEQLY